MDLHFNIPESEDAQPLAWKAPRTGKIIRSIHTGEFDYMTVMSYSCDSTDPSIPYSQLQYSVAPPSPSQMSRDSPSRLLSLDTSGLIAEALYIARPLVHSKYNTGTGFRLVVSSQMNVDYPLVIVVHC